MWLYITALTILQLCVFTHQYIFHFVHVDGRGFARSCALSSSLCEHTAFEPAPSCSWLAGPLLLRYGGRSEQSTVSLLVCVCGLVCETFQPQSFPAVVRSQSYADSCPTRLLPHTPPMWPHPPAAIFHCMWPSQDSEYIPCGEELLNVQEAAR